MIEKHNTILFLVTWGNWGVKNQKNGRIEKFLGPCDTGTNLPVILVDFWLFPHRTPLHPFGGAGGAKERS